MARKARATVASETTLSQINSGCHDRHAPRGVSVDMSGKTPRKRLAGNHSSFSSPVQATTRKTSTGAAPRGSVIGLCHRAGSSLLRLPDFQKAKTRRDVTVCMTLRLLFGAKTAICAKPKSLVSGACAPRHDYNGRAAGHRSQCARQQSIIRIDHLHDLLVVRIDQHDLVADREVFVGRKLRPAAGEFFRHRPQAQARWPRRSDRRCRAQGRTPEDLPLLVRKLDASAFGIGATVGPALGREAALGNDVDDLTALGIDDGHLVVNDRVLIAAVFRHDVDNIRRQRQRPDPLRQPFADIDADVHIGSRPLEVAVAAQPVEHLRTLAVVDLCRRHFTARIGRAVHLTRTTLGLFPTAVVAVLRLSGALMLTRLAGGLPGSGARGLLLRGRRPRVRMLLGLLVLLLALCSMLGAVLMLVLTGQVLRLPVIAADVPLTNILSVPSRRGGLAGVGSLVLLDISRFALLAVGL